jgi:hypothetical protein
MPLSNKKPGKTKAFLDAKGIKRSGESAPNVIGAGKKAKADLKKKAIKETVRATATERLDTSRGLGPDSGSGYRKAIAANKIAGMAGVPTQKGAGKWVATGGSSVSKTVKKRTKQSMDARPELKGKYKP